MRGKRVRLAWQETVYVAVIAVTAAIGFVIETPQPILLAALLTLPASVISVPVYYALYGVLALVPGANPSSAHGYGSSAGPGAPEISVTTGDLAPWFEIATGFLGILLLTLGAVANILLFRAVRAQSPRRRPAA